ncbi:MmgE/PrpD family protein [Mycobacterium sp. 21AC1]|uniref:MmgE/PrpD family protein n=1 Tax=[Mycobacterium] appelbergii TaxID=2939269 RepID=UPI0029393320|nr:MmgE/PrpD family protein [Mycobacterium sp. 21AC1]MDV3127249.1 MmgE/PrpD family protein [Mycobacterium sp. 21AC1]
MNSGPQPSLARTYAHFVSQLRHDQIPQNVRRVAQWHIADSIGVAIAAADPEEPTGQALRAAAERWPADGGSTVYGTGRRLRPDTAALVNGAFGQALEMDDKHGSSLARPGSTVIPAALAAAEDAGSTIADLLTSVVAGYEVMIRLGFVAGKRFLQRGYHTSSLIGGFGSVAAIGNLRGLSASRIVDAFGIAGTMASGIQEATRTGSTSKVLHGGWGAHSGMLASDLAEAGITGPESVFEGEFGFFLTHLAPIEGELDWATASSGLGDRWHTPDTAIKPYPCCQLLHAFIVGLGQLRAEVVTAGLNPTAAESITCRLAEPGLTLVTQPADRKVCPTAPHEARFSLPYVAAHAFLRGDVDLETFREKALADTEVLDLASKVKTGVDPDSDYPAHCPADIEVTVGGREFTRRVPYHPGSPEMPMTESDTLDKFARNAAWLLGREARAIGEQIATMPENAQATDIAAAVAAGGARS